jgi:hypothetical protein
MGERAGNRASQIKLQTSPGLSLIGHAAYFFQKGQRCKFLMFENWLAGRCAPSAVPLVDDVVETSEMVRQNGKELSYPRNRQVQVCVDVYGRCCGSIVAKKLASFGRSSTRFHLDKAWDR